MEEYLEKINLFMERLEADALIALNSISQIKTFKKGDFLLQQGEICNSSFHLEEGILRKFYLNDGKEITTEFFFKGNIAISFESYALQKPSREFIQALTDGVVSQIDFVAFQQAKQKHTKLLELDLLLTEYYTIWVENRLFEFHTRDATQRYMDLIEKQPHIIQNIPLTFIASYLGISIETLSRIRAKR